MFLTQLLVKKLITGHWSLSNMAIATSRQHKILFWDCAFSFECVIIKDELADVAELVYAHA
jgi:hypothetical protein